MVENEIAEEDPVFQVLKQATIKTIEDLFEISQLAATAWSKGEEVLVTVETREKKIKNDITDWPAEQSNNG